MIKKVKNTSLWQRVGALVLGVAVLIYIIYHIASLFGEDIATITTGVSTESTVIDGKGYVFRDETVLYSDNTGVVDYSVTNGSKVSVGQELASVSENGSVSARTMVSYLDEKIAILEQSVNSGYTLAGLPEVNDNISDAYYALAKMMATGDTGSLAEQTDKLLMYMNCHSLLTDENSPVDDALDSMNAKRDSILQSGGDSVVEYASDSGYFYSYVDGYEEYFTVSAADNLNAKNFYRLTDGSTKENSEATEKAYGKLSANTEWRFVVKMSSVASAYFKKDSVYYMEFVENGNAVIPMTLIQSVEDDIYGGSLLVFYANRLPDGFVFDRCQSVNIEVDSYSGIYVPKSAVYKMGGQYCVYVLRGSVVTMRRIDIIYESSEYYLCNPNAESDGSVEYLGANELLIISGSNLFDGRILD